MSLTVPNTFGGSTQKINLSKLDENFEYLKTNIENGGINIVFDGGTPTSTYTSAPSFDCGGVV